VGFNFGSRGKVAGRKVLVVVAVAVVVVVVVVVVMVVVGASAAAVRETQSTGKNYSPTDGHKVQAT